MFILAEITSNYISTSSNAVPTELDLLNEISILFYPYILPIIFLIVLIMIYIKLRDIKKLLTELASNRTNEKKDL